ncbi:MAG: hypothetical protein JXQ29_11530 [Planctomycetes bacterium]|nr:hypothetical protein [Planctomycetota bacterium]
MRRLCSILFLAAVLGFALAALAVAQDAAPEPLTFDRYHDSAETARVLQQLARQHPGLLRVEPIGKSGRGRDILLATMTDLAAGKPEDKPGIFVDGNLHGNERIGGEAALFLVDRLLSGRDRDPRIAELLRTRVFYVVPKVNPDAADVWVRGILEPDDDDGDGRLDEDGPEDVSGDGLITSMRIPDPDGPFLPAEDGRLMRRFETLSVKERKRYRGLRYRVLLEGLDNDGDGAINEDGPDWQIDPNRDFPADLEMERKYRKKFARSGATRTAGRPSRVPGSAPAEPEFLRTAETRALAALLNRHNNIALALSFHSYGNVLFRPFGYMPDHPCIPRDDRERFEELGRSFTRRTGFHGFGPPYLGERQVVGGLHDYLYWHLGCPALSVEIWGIPGVGPDWADRDRRQAEGRRGNRPRREDLAATRQMLEWIDRERVTDAFVPWQPLRHPTLGEIEVGGLWDPARLRYNPPPSRIATVVEPFVRFTVDAAWMTPCVRILAVDIRPTPTRARSVEVEVANTGGAPTAWTLAVQRKRAGTVRTRVVLPEGYRLSSGEIERDLGHLKPGESVRVRWSVVPPEGEAPPIAVEASSPKGGTDRHSVRIEPPADRPGARA